VLGGTGIVGQRFIQLLKDHPFFELSVIVASKKNHDKIYREAVHWMLECDVPSYIENLKIKNFDLKLFQENDVKIVFSALPPDVAEKQEKILADNGFAVFSNSRAYRYKNNVPILIPEVNPDHIKLVDSQKNGSNGFIITNANCSTTGLALALKPLLQFKIRNVFVSTYQALSGAGYPGVASLNINSNVIPYIHGEEEKIELETKKILGDLQNQKVVTNGIKIISSCARVPVRDGHLESVVVEFEKELDLSTIKNAFSAFPPVKNLYTSPNNPIILREEVDRPQPWTDAYAGLPDQARGMSVTVGNLKKQGRWIRFWLVVHNTIRGAAGNSVLNAEYALQKGYILGGN